MADNVGKLVFDEKPRLVFALSIQVAFDSKILRVYSLFMMTTTMRE